MCAPQIGSSLKATSNLFNPMSAINATKNPAGFTQHLGRQLGDSVNTSPAKYTAPATPFDLTVNRSGLGV